MNIYTVGIYLAAIALSTVLADGRATAFFTIASLSLVLADSRPTHTNTHTHTHTHTHTQTTPF